MDGSPLHIACQYGHEAVVKALVDAGANVNTVNKHGWAPLHIACQYGHEAVVKALVDAGANVNTVNKHGWTPLHISVSIRT